MVSPSWSKLLANPEANRARMNGKGAMSFELQGHKTSREQSRMFSRRVHYTSAAPGGKLSERLLGEGEE